MLNVNIAIQKPKPIPDNLFAKTQGRGQIEQRTLALLVVGHQQQIHLPERNRDLARRSFGMTKPHSSRLDWRFFRRNRA